MKQSGQIVLFHFPQTDLQSGKSRPALLIGKLPGQYDDWLICMISTQLRHHIDGFDEIVQTTDADFEQTGLKEPSVIRVGRLAVVNGNVLLGAVGEIAPHRLHRVKQNLSEWILQVE
ncbi:MAG: type II toxin-antitoxin system PemK/MazF family toxin [Ardenticatenaceae bacterium]|nr:type II toxin-antitoxin system PemK/MazF family toxin [Anaerolineales bacterium]MCB8923558.1 type II toxin-antitoxin system PemK/MazF family toxin [Ardenticatenaceae bacterium]MCB8991706.1 type II toxin-antitoxin system PemK/MazF family toxin [Ardenticatenaceae bacterium]